MSSSAKTAVASSSTRTQKPSAKVKESKSGSATPLEGASSAPPTSQLDAAIDNNVLADLGMSFGTGDENGSSDLWDFRNATGGGSSSMPFASTSAISDQQSMALLQQQQHQLGMGASLPMGSAVPPSSLYASSFQPGNSAQQPSLQDSVSPSPLLSTSRPTASQIPSHIAKNNPFLNKLRSMVDDPKTDDLIRWSDDGETFLVPNHERFGNEVLPRFFKHNRFSSFVRQLNMYGFHKVPHLQQGALKSDPGQDTELWEFSCPQFKRDRPELLLQMQRKKGVRVEDEAKETGKGKGKGDDDDGRGITLDAINGALTRAQRGEGETGLMQLASVWSAIQAIQSAQQGINDNLRHLHNNNNDLWREAAEQRTRSKKQEETINKMLRFLAGVFGAQDVNNIGAHADQRADTASPPTSSNSPRRNNAVLRPNHKARRRLLISDGTTPGGQIEELEVPSLDDDYTYSGDVEELTPHGRITEARSGSNSPQNTDSPPSRFHGLPKTPHGDSKQTPLPSIASDATATPGGGRRISQQAGAQLLNALASGEAQSWLANMFGQQPASANNMQSPGTRNDNLNSAAVGNGSFKLDAQTLAALQGILTAGAGSNDAQPNGYFDSMNGGVGSEPFVNAQPQQPSRASASAVSPRSQSAQLARLTPQQQQLQSVSQDANVVQNALNALVEGLRLENNGANATFGTDAGGATPMNAAAVPSQNGASSGLDLGQGQGDGAGASAEVDMDSLLKEFFNESGINLDNGAGGVAAGNDLINGYEGPTPAFAFSPEPAADVNTVEPKGSEESTGANTAASSARNSPPLSTKTAGKSRKRKLLDDDSLGSSDVAATALRSHGGKAKTTRQ